MLHLATDEEISVFSPGQRLSGVLEQRPAVKARQLRLTLRCFSADGYGQKTVLWQQMQVLAATVANNAFHFTLPKPAYLSGQGPLFSIAWELLAERCRQNMPCESKSLEILLLAPDLSAVERPKIRELANAIPMQGRPAWRFFLPQYCLGLQQQGHNFRLSWHGLDKKPEAMLAKTAELQLWQALRYRRRWQQALWRTLPLPLNATKNNMLLTLPTSWPLPFRTAQHQLFYRLRFDQKTYTWPQR